MKRLKTRALEVLPVSPSVTKASSRCQTLRMNSALIQSLHEDRVVTSKPVCQKYRGEPYPRMISIAGNFIHPGRGSPASVSPPMSLMSSVRMTLASVSRLEDNCLSKRKTTRVPRSASGKAELGEHFEEQDKVVL
jgi:hypothetical protein